MTRGISATFDDGGDDMALGRMPRHSLHKQRLPPILQHPGEHHDHHHHHLSNDVEQRRQQLQPVFDQARKEGKHVEFVRDKLYINNCLYHPDHSNHFTPSNAKSHPKFY